jgi:hypothetical protein
MVKFVSLSMQGLGLGLGLGLPLTMGAIYIAFYKLMKKKKMSNARESRIITKEESPIVHSLTASPSHNVV